MWQLRSLDGKLVRGFLTDQIHVVGGQDPRVDQAVVQTNKAVQQRHRYRVTSLEVSGDLVQDKEQ